MIDFILILLPVVVVGIAVILSINNVKKTNEKRKAFEDEKANQNEENPEENYMAIGMLFGVAIGTIFFNAESRPYGICFGMLFGMVIGMSIKKK